MEAVRARHPLSKYKRISPEEVLRYPLVLRDILACEGHARQLDRPLRQVDQEPLIVEQNTSFVSGSAGPCSHARASEAWLTIRMSSVSKIDQVRKSKLALGKIDYLK